MITYQDYLQNVAFKRIKPHSAYNFGLGSAIGLQLLNKCGLNIEAINTHLPVYNPRLAKDLIKLSRIPKASTYALGAIINRIVSQMDHGSCFLNIGVWHGFTFLSGLIDNPDKRCIGVDNFGVHKKINANGEPEYHGLKRLIYKKVDAWAKRSFNKRFNAIKSGHHDFFEMDYVDYFRLVHTEPIGFYIYDAQHRYTDQLRALRLAEPFFTENCIVFIDDTNAADNREATLDFIKNSPFDYEMLLDVNTFSNRHPTFWNGIMIFKRKPRALIQRAVSAQIASDACPPMPLVTHTPESNSLLWVRPSPAFRRQ